VSTQHVEVRPGAYADSVTLLQVSRDVSAVEGVRAAQVAMATPLNVEVLESMGFEIPAATPNDMVVALDLVDEAALDRALAAVRAALDTTRRAAPAAGEVAPPRTTRSAVGPGDLVLVSVPGEHALTEAMDALDADCDVMVFSDNVPVAHEVALKQLATERGLLVMGPDCGTAVVGGLGLGFANSMSGGGAGVGIVAASGTGCQQVMCLLDAAGIGVSDALGVGGRDLSAPVGGLSTRAALARLDADPAVKQVVVVSKPPAPEVAEALEEYAASLATPVRFLLLGAGRPDLTAGVEEALRAWDLPVPEWPTWGQAAAAPSSGFVRGLFAGGTLCEEAVEIVAESVGEVRSNLSGSVDADLDGFLTGTGHAMVDFGDDSLTRGRVHPMIDPAYRLEHLARVAADPATGVVLLDVVLGHGAEADPAGSLAPAIAAARAERDLPVVVSCVGTDSDPQELTRQARTLAEAGAEVHLSNAAAARRAAQVVSGGSR
jgi:FdrA protein